MRSLCVLAVCWWAGSFSGELARAEITGPWREELRPEKAGRAVELRSFAARFVFGWSNVPAGEAEVEFRTVGRDRYAVEAKGGTTGWVRSLWQLDATYEGTGGDRNLLTDRFSQREIYRRHRIELDAEFSPESARRKRQRRPSHEENAWRTYKLPGMRDVFATMLFVRSQPLRKGDEVVLVCFPGDTPYLVRVRSQGREKVSWQEKEIAAIRLDLRLQRIEGRGENKGELSDHRRFRRATIWLADDEYRLPLRAEVSVFVGFVYAELESWQPLRQP
jgi:hypothetical protein